MLKGLHAAKGIQLVIGLITGIVFGFLLQKGGVTEYNILIGQLLLEDFTVAKVILMAIAVGMPGIFVLEKLGLVRLHIKKGSVGASLIGGIIFGVGFGLLGYCPGTVTGAAGQGSLDALLGGIPGQMLGAGLFAWWFSTLDAKILNKGDFGKLTIPDLLKVNRLVIVIAMEIAIIVSLVLLEVYA
ncbi:putative inner membrane protein [Anaerohalosphaera lusitana]|uniref:Putative inner membrane protein n=1 Tax=Anaerohalosphaera lusitana TaxID=1936003 RepID=A0A1U9NQD4_9BACT|nr:YeeE/YedE thiosulfate transporter family protein [Anaerohalosphaera lusitana]AQT70143.1 putative inner membrane protein [Anaerohalosphaera lusitana]